MRSGSWCSGLGVGFGVGLGNRLSFSIFGVFGKLGKNVCIRFFLRQW